MSQSDVESDLTNSDVNDSPRTDSTPMIKPLQLKKYSKRKRHDKDKLVAKIEHEAQDEHISNRIKQLMKFPQKQQDALNSGDFTSLRKIYAEDCLEDVIMRPPNMPPTKGREKTIEMLSYMFKAMPDMVFTYSKPIYHNGIIDCDVECVGTYLGSSSPDDNLYNIFRSPYRYAIISKESCDIFDALDAAGQPKRLKSITKLRLILNMDNTFIAEVVTSMDSMTVEGIAEELF